jgi:hypothetical protein
VPASVFEAFFNSRNKNLYDRFFYHGEFDSGSERTLAARLKHASRTRIPVLALGREWRTGE